MRFHLPRPLGRRIAFDERSRAYGIADIETRTPRNYTWACPTVLDQGSEPACVGFSWSHDLIARPVVVKATDQSARELYQQARAIDAEEGRQWDAGASVLAGVKALKRAGLVTEYRWAFGVDQLAAAVTWQGPAVIGVEWTEDMFNPGPDGYLRLGGKVVGGHALLVRAYSRTRVRFLLHNSWGASWGGRGTAPAGCAWVTHDDMGYLLSRSGEACIPVRRGRPR